MGGCPQSAQALIFGLDDRIIVSTNAHSPYSPVGIVYSSTTGLYTTGFLISPCKVLTVRHSAAAAIGAKVQFSVGEIGRAGDWKVSGGKVIAVGSAPSIDPSSEVGPGDWAVVQLDRCLGKRFGYAALDRSAPSARSDLAMAGYPSDRRLEGGLSLDGKCSVRSFEAGMALHDCAMQPGNSGSPIFYRPSADPQHLHVVAINSGGWSYGVPGATLRTPITAYHPAYANRAIPIASIVSDLDQIGLSWN